MVRLVIIYYVTYYYREDSSDTDLDGDFSDLETSEGNFLQFLRYK